MLTKSIAVALLATSFAAPVEGVKPAPQIATDAVRAMLQVTDFHYVLSSKYKGDPMHLNINVSRSGGGGTVQFNGSTVQVVSHDHAYYLKGSEKSLDALTGGHYAWAKKYAGKWVRFPAPPSERTYWQSVTRSPRIIHIAVPGNLVNQFANDGETTVDGRSALTITGPGGIKIYVAATGKPYILREDFDDDPGDRGTYKFSDFGDAPIPKVPKTFFHP